MFSPETKEAASALLDIMVTTVIKVGVFFFSSNKLDRILGFRIKQKKKKSFWRENVESISTVTQSEA